MKRSAARHRPKLRKRVLRHNCIGYAIAFICLIALVTLGVNAAMLVGMRSSIVSMNDLPTDADCVLVLGAGVRADGTPSPMLADRIATGVAVYENGGGTKLLMSGDHGKPDYDEVNCMKREAIRAGVPSEDIFMDHAGFSTYDSLYRAKYIFGAQKIVIVTQEYHLYRALYLANALGVEAVGVAADKQLYAGQSLREVREAVARVKDMVFAIWQPKSAVTGNAISLTESGDVTNDKTDVMYVHADLWEGCIGRRIACTTSFEKSSPSAPPLQKL